MPRINFATLPLEGAQSWRSYYDNGSNGYGTWLRSGQMKRPDRLVNGPLYDSGGGVVTPHPFSFAPADRILIVGCGAGYSIEGFRMLGFPNTWGLDYSSVLEASTGIITPGIESQIAWVNVAAGGQAKARLRNVTGDDIFDWVISEDVLPCYDTGAEMDGLLDAAESVLTGSDLSQIIHMVTPLLPDNTQDPDFLWLSLDDWKAVRPTHSWVSTQWGYR